LILHTIKTEIEELIYNNATDFEIAKVLKREIKLYFGRLDETFANSGGKDFLVKHTKKIDSILRVIYMVAQRAMFGDYAPMKNSIPIALVALGSYGREQLCLYSDIDLMIVYKRVDGYNMQMMIEKIFYILLDTGLKLGHRVHEVDELYEVSKSDITIKTAILESRFIEGSKFIWTETQNSIKQIRHDNPKEFIRLKIEEQEKKHTKYPLTMQPNLKEGIGGFRDANLVYWVGKVLFNVDNIKNLPDTIVKESEYKPFRIALEFLFRVRSALHLVSNKKEDRLRLELIPDIARLLGYEDGKDGQMQCAKRVTESLKIIRLYSTIWLNLLTRDYIEDNPNKTFLYPTNEKQEFNSLLKQLSSFANKPFYPHPSFLHRLITVERPQHLTDEIYKSVRSFFYQPYSHSIVNALSHARLLHYTIPPMRAVVDLPQFDGYHKFAVDIHSIRSLYHIEHITNPDIKSLFNALTKDEKMMLKVVTFLHDAGKGRKTNHHIIGVSLFKTFATSLNIKPKLIEDGSRIILYHTLMSNIAQREDIYNQNTIIRFVSHFPNKKLLDMIYILTYSDMSGVGGDIYNAFTARLINTLYRQSITILESKTPLDITAKRIKKEEALKKNSEFLLFSKLEQKRILQIPSDLIFLRYSISEIIDINKRAFQTQDYTFTIDNSSNLTIEVIRKTPFNISYLLGSLSKLEIINMDICKLFNGLKYFKIDFTTTVEDEDINDITRVIHKSFKDNKKSLLVKPTIEKSEITIDCDHSDTYATMNINCRNQKGIVAHIINIFDDMQIDIATAKINTIKNRAKDMFLIEKNGNFCQNVDEIIERLI